MNRRFLKTNILFLSMLLSLTSCGDFFKNAWSGVVEGAKDVADKIVKFADPVIDNITNGAKYVYDNAAHFTKEAIENIKKKATELAGNVEEYFVGTNPNDLAKYEIKYANPVEHPNKDASNFDNPQGFNHLELYSQDFEEFIPYYVSTILKSYGYDVFAGVAFCKGVHYSGLIFTNNTTFIQYQGKDTPTCGFLQIKLDGENSPTVTEEIVQKGLIAVPNKSFSSENNYQKGFVVIDSTDIDNQAGIYLEQYFEFKQITRYCLNVKVEDTLPASYKSYPYEIYDFNNKKIVKEKSVPTIRDELLSIEKSNRNALEKGVLTNNAISSISECCGNNESVNAVISLTSKDINIKKEKLLENVTRFSDSYDGSLDNNQVRGMGDKLGFDEAKTSENIISLVGNSLSLVGTVATVIIGVVAGTPMIKAVVLTTGTSAIVYNVSNILENCQNIYYGLNKKEEEAINPVYKAFNSVIKDDVTAKIVYHAWGIASTVITGLTRPITKSLEISHALGLGKFRTAVNVVRAVLVTVVKAGTSAIGGALVGNFVTKIVTYVTDSRFIGNIVGFGSSLIVGILIFKGLDKLDQKLNASGLYPKSEAVASYSNDRSAKEKEYTWGDQNKDFKSLPRSDKETYVRSIRDMACNDLGIEDKPRLNIVYDYSHPDSCGSYSYYDNTLTVNLAADEHTTWSGIADTIGHECRHAYQYTFSPGSEMYESLHNYIPPEESYDAYRYQLCESDAFDYGSRFASWFLNLIGIAY